MDLERTLIILKPDTIQRGLMGEVIGRIEQRGMRVIAMKMMWVDEALAERHYGEHKGKSFYEPLLDFITSGPEAAMERLRGLIGDDLEWRALRAFLPSEWLDAPDKRRSATAATFAAMLELVRRGELELRQEETFGEIALRRRMETHDPLP